MSGNRPLPHTLSGFSGLGSLGFRDYIGVVYGHIGFRVQRLGRRV